MKLRSDSPFRATAGAFLRRLARDRAGNTLAMIAAAILPILAMVGGGVDMGRSYLSQSRLQQACDAGVLAARKRLGSEAAVTGEIPEDVAEIGHRFFNINFRDGAYGTERRAFQMTLEEDYAISGAAAVNVPTTIMAIFGHTDVPIQVECEAQINFNNTDVMMVLDVTGSMGQANPGDSSTRLEVLRDTVKNFHAQLEAAAVAGTRIRYGFVPYSTNVNVGHLLEDDWVVPDWKYQSRRWTQTGTTESTRTYTRNWQTESGTASGWVTESTYDATYHPGSGTGEWVLDENENMVYVPAGEGYYTCDTPAPADSVSNTDTLIATNEYPFVGPPSGTQVVKDRHRVTNGTDYYLTRSGETCMIKRRDYDQYTRTYQEVTEPVAKDVYKWQYNQFEFDVSDWRTSSNGCIEERDTYEIKNYDNVDFSRALDLDIDLVPTAGNPKTQWRPSYPSIIYARSIKWNGTGSWTKSTQTTRDEYVNPDAQGSAACPAQALKLTQLTSSELEDYVDTLWPNGSTYHDIGMIWGGRLISPTGLFAAENADASSTQPTSRHLIFLTDGETGGRDIAYGAYGLEPLDARRWDEKSKLSLNETIEQRFAVACSEVRKKNVTVWVIGFGTTLNPVMKECAGEGYYFEAANAAELNATFAAIVKNMAELRIRR